MELHDQRVRAIAAGVKSFYEKKQKFRINHGSTNSTRNQVLRDRKNVITTTDLNNVLSVDPKRMIAVVEPNVPMDRLTEATLKFNCIPPVVMDFPGITVGGGYAGTACESSSFKHGYFNRTVIRVEMVLPNGDIVTCSEEERPDLFHGAAAALGTLGVVTLLELQLEQAKKYVETTYHPVSSFQEALDKCGEFTSEANYETFDYVDGILFSETSGAIITGRRTNDTSADMPIQRFSAPSDPWFAWHVQERIANVKDGITELIPLPEYLFRYDRGGFWVGYSIFEYSRGLLPFNKQTRSLLDTFMHTRMLYAAAHASPYNVQIIQDMAVPYSTSSEFLEWTSKKLNIWPLWLCPLKSSAQPTLHPHTRDTPADSPMMNVGIWGAPPDTSFPTFVSINRALEEKLFELGGQKWMYGVTFQTEQEFWRNFDRKWYEDLREKYHASWMPSIFDKAASNPKDVEHYLSTATLKEILPFIFPGLTVTCLYRAWKTGAWGYKKESTWPSWVPREK